MSFITKKLEEFDKRFPNSPINWSFVSSDIRAFLSTTLNEMIKEVEKGLPTPERMINFNFFKEKERANKILGFEDCLNQIKQSLSSLREGNK